MATRHFAALASLALAALLLTGCANGTPNAGNTPGGASMSASPSPSPSSPSETPSGLPSGMSLPPSLQPTLPTAGPEQTLHGQVEAGVEHGCLILRANGGMYQLMGGDPKIVYAGATITVTGHLVTGIMSYCMQGRPFQITHAQTG